MPEFGRRPDNTMIQGLTNAGAIPVLERVMQFAGQRHEILSHNIANISTPNFRPVDVSVEGFQEALGEAIDRRRSQHGSGGKLVLPENEHVATQGERLVLNPVPMNENLLFHDGNDRNIERIMQGLVENFMTFRAASQFIRRDFETLKTAMRERM